MTIATVDDVKLRWGFGSFPHTDAFTQVSIEDYETDLLEALPDLEDWILTGKVAEKKVVKVVSEAVVKFLFWKANPYQMENQAATGVVSRTAMGGDKYYRENTPTAAELDALTPEDKRVDPDAQVGYVSIGDGYGHDHCWDEFWQMGTCCHVDELGKIY